jgi:hypothetical protein
MDEDTFWRCTPKKLQCLFDVHSATKGDAGEPAIDDLVF